MRVRGGARVTVGGGARVRVRVMLGVRLATLPALLSCCADLTCSSTSATSAGLRPVHRWKSASTVCSSEHPSKEPANSAGEANSRADSGPAPPSPPPWLGLEFELELELGLGLRVGVRVQVRVRVRVRVGVGVRVKG